MRSTLTLICAALVALGVFLASRTTAPLTPSTSPLAAATVDKVALGKAIREYLVANPEVLVEAMQEYERRQDSQRDAAAEKAIKENRQELVNDPDTPVAGNPKGDVTIVEFSDYQCPYCKRAHSAVKSVVAADGKVKLIYKELPILGEASKIAAVAALAAVKQGKHLAFHDALMEYNGKLDSDRIFEIAGSVGIDVAQLKKDMDDPGIKKIIERNLALASALGVRGTPAFVVGNQFVPGAVDADTLKQLIADARKG
jgi:protein-disulfide isomerase